jgi:hypothetical protein
MGRSALRNPANPASRSSFWSSSNLSLFKRSRYFVSNVTKLSS